MCGICGELRFDGAPVDPRTLGEMSDRIAHRGPDHADAYLSGEGPVGLGFRRLKIIDLTAVANQPMPNEDGSIRVVFNGEIYNYLALREDLVARGHRFRSQSDTETIVHLYEELGADCIERLDGMFALAIWDEPKGRLLLGRGPPGPPARPPILEAEVPAGLGRGGDGAGQGDSHRPGARAGHRGGEAPHDERRAARRVPERRHRFDGGGGRHAPPRRHAAQDLQYRVRGGRGLRRDG